MKTGEIMALPLSLVLPTEYTDDSIAPCDREGCTGGTIYISLISLFMDCRFAEVSTS